MRRRTSRSQQNEEDLNIWQAFTDLMSSTFLIMSLFLLLVLVKAIFLQATANQTFAELNESKITIQQLQSTVQELNGQIITNNDKTKTLQSQLTQKTSEAQEMKRKLESAPVILINDSATLRFETGRADLSAGLIQYIKNDLVPDLEKKAKEYPEYQTIDVVGHTDGQATIQGNPSNLDTNLEDVAKGKKPINSLQPGSNTDLGLIRALAVVKKLQEEIKDDKKNNSPLKNLKFRAYSAGQLLLPDGTYADSSDRTSNPSRRRIEIRFSPNPKPSS